MKENYKVLGKNIRKYRRAADFTQEQLADMIGYTGSHVGSIENATGIPSLEMLFRIANALHITLDQICYGSVDNPDGYLMSEFNRLTEGYDTNKKRCAVEIAVSVWGAYREHHNE